MTIKSVVIPDVHVPFHSRHAVRRLIQYLTEERPDRIVFLGDVMDFHALSVHRQDPKWQDSLEKELKAGRRFLAQVREASPGARIQYIQGNHEDRWNRYVAGRVPALRLVGIKWPDALDMAAREIEVVNTAKKKLWLPTSMGQRVRIMHGHELKGSSKFPGGHAYNIACRLGCNVHIGHTHRLGLLAGVAGNKEVFGVEGGYLGDHNQSACDFMGPARPPWTQAWAVYDTSKKENPYPTFVR